MSVLLNAKEVAAKLGRGEAWFHKHRPTLAPLFQIPRPIGQKRYSSVLVDRYVSGQSPTKFGRGSRPR